MTTDANNNAYAEELARQAVAELKTLTGPGNPCPPPTAWRPVPYTAHAPERGVTLDGGPLHAAFDRNIAYLNDWFERKKHYRQPTDDIGWEALGRYWQGDPGALPVRHDYALDIKDPTAVIRSLGKAPIPGKNSAPELYFDVLYTRAAGLAQALAFAGGLNEDAEAEAPDEPAPAG